jgi:DNA segregation ATPase FtsK/SpoIIIE, S-DNA-T family
VSADTEDPPVLEGRLIQLSPGDRSYEVNLDDDLDVDDLPSGPVEPHGPIELKPSKPKRRPIIPVHLDSREKIGRRARELWSDVAYHVAFQGIRIPYYLVVHSWWALIGMGRFTDRQRRWWWVAEASLILSKAVVELDGGEYRKQHNHVRQVRGWRGTALGAEAASILFAAVLVARYAPGWMQATAALLAWGALAQLGRPRDRTIFTPTMIKPRVRLINGDVVIRAYHRAGLCDPEKPGLELAFPAPMSRDEQDRGSRVPVNLPYGTTYEQAVKVKDKIASGLDVKLSQVYLIEDDESERTHVLYVADKDPLAEPAGRTPLLDLKQRNIWRDAPFGLDQFGRKVAICLMWISILIGAQPRKGKTFAARSLALFAALDPYVRLIVVDGKSSTDWSPFKGIAHRFVQGTRPTRHYDPAVRLLDVLDEVIKHIDDVNAFLETLDISECPEGKITEELSRRYDVCRVWGLVMEEWQVYFELDDQEVNKLVAAKLSDIKARGPSAGVWMLSSTQKPSGIGAGDVSRLANRFRDNHDVRFGLRCGNRDVSNAVLGNEAYGEGYDCSKLPLGKRFRGVGILYGLVDEAPTVRTYLADGEDALVICEAGRRMRERLGLLTGDAATDDLGLPARDVLGDVLAVFGDDDRLQWAELAERLAGSFPDRWAGVTGEAISAQCRAKGVARAQAKRDGVNRQGCKRSDVTAAARAGAA